MVNNGLFSESTQVNLYNLGASFKHVQEGLLFYHSIESAINKTKVHWAIVGVVAMGMLQALSVLPYKWDKFWMRIHAFISLFLSSVTLGVYLSNNLL